MDHPGSATPDSNIPDGLGSENHASSTFNDPSADAVLRSTDGVDFRVHKTILSAASPMFKAMFTLPTPEHKPVKREWDPSAGYTPVIAMSETSSTLETLLAFCYPMPNPSLAEADLPQLKALAIAVEKFEMAFADEIDRALIAFTARADSTLAIYAAGCQLRRPRVIQAAASRSLAEPFMAYWSPELYDINAAQLYRFLVYHRRCAEAVTEFVLLDWSWIGSIANIPLAKTTQECNCLLPIAFPCPLEGAAIQLSQTGHRSSYMCYVPHWWYNYMKRTEVALRQTPCPAVPTSDVLYGAAVTEAMVCENARCRIDAREALIRFVHLFARQVDSVIREIEGPERLSVQT